MTIRNSDTDLLSPSTSAPSRSGELRGKTLLFVHIHKTAGTTLHRIIESQYNPFRIYTIEGRMIEWSIRHFKALPERRRARYEVIKGHMSFGLHEFLPQPFTYITFLRNPVERAISSYYYARGNPMNPFYKRIARENLDLLTYLRLTPWNNDMQCKVIAGLPREVYRPREIFAASLRAGAGVPDAPEIACTAQTLATAKENLQSRISFTGLTERFSESLVLLRDLFGWNLDSYSNFRKSRDRPNREALSPAILSEVQELNRHDMELYELGKVLFERSIIASRLVMADETARLKVTAPAGKWAVMRQWQSVACRTAASRLASLF